MLRTVLIIFLTFLNLQLAVNKVDCFGYFIPTVEDVSCEEEIKTAIYESGILFPEVVLAQCKLETGLFTSHILHHNNNLFGMKLAMVRPTTAIGCSRNHACYKNWRDSVRDYYLWQKYWIKHGKLKTESREKYLNSLVFYASDTNYIDKLQKLIES